MGSIEFEERKQVLLLERENIELKHKFKMMELEFDRESSKIFHERELERQRIKSAEIRKMQERKQQSYDFKNFSR